MSQNQPEIQYAAFLAIDWADQKHVWSLQDANSSTCEGVKKTHESKPTRNPVCRFFGH